MPDDIAGPPPVSQNTRDTPSPPAPSTVAGGRTRIAAETDLRTTEAALRLQARFGDAHQRRQAADPDGARLPAAELMALVVSAGSDQRASDAGVGDFLDALLQIARARQELEQQESQLLWLARSQVDDRRRLTWAEIADTLGLNSAQAAQQRYRPSTESIVRNARADELLHEEWKTMTYPPHDARLAEWGECLCESCQEADNRDPG